MKKILELGEPISATYSHAAHTLAILANEKNNSDWLMTVSYTHLTLPTT